MDTVLYLAHTQSDETLSKGALEALTAAKELTAQLGSANLVVAILGGDVQTAADSVADCGASKFLGVSGEAFAQSRYATDAAAIEALCRTAQPAIVLCGSSSRFNRVLPGVASRLGGCADLHATEVKADGGSTSITRWYYRQRIRAAQVRDKRPWFVALETGSDAPWITAGGKAAVESVPVALPESSLRTTVEGLQKPPGQTQTIRPDADLLYVAGAGWTKKQADGEAHIQDAESIILDFLGKTQASLGGSKSLVDISGTGQAVLSFMTHLNQIGQTGAIPRHPKGLSTCCHGEEPHAVGWRFIHERRAINLDANCGWAHGKADVLYVADAFEVMRKVNALLEKS
ncbi:MAG: electron transfer flavoprotein subunit alpha [Candidatus Hydrogenedentes bacterium]|nr:electron transfer flavoprotein subunit alpha [Candidatus Hydrogenedentota bacterium]